MRAGAIRQGREAGPVVRVLGRKFHNSLTAVTRCAGTAAVLIGHDLPPSADGDLQNAVLRKARVIVKLRNLIDAQRQEAVL